MNWSKKIKHQLTDFKYPNSLSKFGLDAYIVVEYPREHKNYPLYIGDKIYWMDLFDKNKRNRRGVKVPKGFVEISI
jgi:signal recognition particle subunit SEC65